MTKPERIESVDLLRGIAALAVVVSHFGFGGPLEIATSHGALGVHVFFVISGFILPYSMLRSHYVVRDYGRFILKRIVRLDPPYLLSILVQLILLYLLHLKNGSALPGTTRVLLHLGYLNAFVGYEWLCGVYWSLAIEFQYYLTIGLLLPLVVSPRRSVRNLTLGTLTLFSFILPGPRYIFSFLGLFMMGITCIQYLFDIIDRRTAVLQLAGCFVICCLVLGIAEAGVGLITAIVILLVRTNGGKIGSYLGMMSYSLYLFHQPVGGTIRSILLKRLPDVGVVNVSVSVACIFVSIAAAALMYVVIERPSQQLSKKIHLGRRLVTA